MESKKIALHTLIQASVIALVVLIVLLIINAAEVFFVVFGGILFAILFHGIAHWLSSKTKLSRRWTLPLALVFPVLILGISTWAIAPDVANQARELAERIPTAFDQIEQQAREYEWIDKFFKENGQTSEILSDSSKTVGIVAGLLSSTFGALTNLAVALFVGLFLVVDPKIYINGLLHLVPFNKRPRASDVLDKTGSVLQSWLLAKIAEMVIIGVLTTLGLWLIGIDLALVLGIIAAILSFIPNIGPIIALIPAALIGLIGGMDKLFYVVILYVAVQTLESYLLTPLLQQRMVNLPPALVISVQVLFGFIAGILGIILATPLLAAVMVMINMLYVEDMLGDRSE